jgi:hypothetical protein
MRIASHHHDLLHGERKCQLDVLGENGATPRQRRRVERCDGGLAIQHLAG